MLIQQLPQATTKPIPLSLKKNRNPSGTHTTPLLLITNDILLITLAFHSLQLFITFTLPIKRCSPLKFHEKNSTFTFSQLSFYDFEPDYPKKPIPPLSPIINFIILSGYNHSNIPEKNSIFPSSILPDSIISTHRFYMGMTFFRWDIGFSIFLKGFVSPKGILQAYRAHEHIPVES